MAKSIGLLASSEDGVAVQGGLFLETEGKLTWKINGFDKMLKSLGVIDLQIITFQLPTTQGIPGTTWQLRLEVKNWGFIEACLTLLKPSKEYLEREFKDAPFFAFYKFETKVSCFEANLRKFPDSHTNPNYLRLFEISSHEQLNPHLESDGSIVFKINVQLFLNNLKVEQNDSRDNPSPFSIAAAAFNQRPSCSVPAHTGSKNPRLRTTAAKLNSRFKVPERSVGKASNLPSIHNPLGPGAHPRGIILHEELEERDDPLDEVGEELFMDFIQSKYAKQSLKTFFQSKKSTSSGLEASHV